MPLIGDGPYLEQKTKEEKMRRARYFSALVITFECEI